MTIRWKPLIVVVAASGLAAFGAGLAGRNSPEPGEDAPLRPTRMESKGSEVEAKSPPRHLGPLPPEAARGLAWLVSKQGRDGGFGQNDGAEPDVANTAMAALALLRGGNTPSSGPHREALRAAIEFVRREVAAAEDDSPYVTKRRDTQPQRKIGPYVDTFLAGQLLGEVDGTLPDEVAQRLLRSALERCVAKIERTQAADGSFNQGGWAPVLGSTFACKALQTADAKGVRVDRDVLARAEDYMAGLRNRETGRFATEAAAGVSLYTVSGAASSLTTASAPPAAEIRAAVEELGKPEVLRGFGSMGGEEFVSFMMASTAIASVGGQGSVQWNANIRSQLGELQNEDGSWAGHHCITGRVFCTSAAVLTLLESETLKTASAAK